MIADGYTGPRERWRWRRPERAGITNFVTPSKTPTGTTRPSSWSRPRRERTTARAASGSEQMKLFEDMV